MMARMTARRLPAHPGRYNRPGVSQDDGSADDGNAVVEFVFVAIIAFVPLIYLIVAVAVLTQSRAAVAQAARDAGRAFATADSSASGRDRALLAARLDMSNAGLDDNIDLHFVAADAQCSAPTVAPELVPGGQYRVCVLRHVDVPAVPSILQGKGVTVEGSFQLYIDDYRRPG